MGNLFGSINAPQEDPAVKRARERQERIADNLLTSELQRDLRDRTRSRLRRFGLFTPVDSAAGGRASATLGGARAAIAASGRIVGRGAV